MRRANSVLLIAAVLSGMAGLTACSREDAMPKQDPRDAAQTQAYRVEFERWRAKREGRLRSADGWLSLVGLHWIEPGAHYIGSGADNGMRIDTGPAHLGMIELRDGRLRFTPDKAAEVTLDGKPLKSATTLASDKDGEPSVVAFDGGEANFTVIERTGRFAVRVRDARAKTRTAFAGLEYFDPDPAWRLQARFEPHPPGRTIDIATIINTIEPMANPGAVVFEKDGKPYRLEAVDEGDGRLFLIFADRTSGHATYGAGRYLYALKADSAGRTVVDFNQAYNPPCAFTPHATCPLPPPENRLDLAITAGEKKYGADAH